MTKTLQQNLVKCIKLVGKMGLCASALFLSGCHHEPKDINTPIVVKEPPKKFSLTESINNSAVRPYKPYAYKSTYPCTTFPQYTPESGTLTIKTTNKTLVNQNGQITQLDTNDNTFGKTGPFRFGHELQNGELPTDASDFPDYDRSLQDDYDVPIYDNVTDSSNIDNYTSNYTYEWTPMSQKYTNNDEGVQLYNSIYHDNLYLKQNNKNWRCYDNNEVFNSGSWSNTQKNLPLPSPSPLYWAMHEDVQGFQQKHVLTGFLNCKFSIKNPTSFMGKPDIYYLAPVDNNSNLYDDGEHHTNAELSSKQDYANDEGSHYDTPGVYDQYPDNDFSYPINGYEKSLDITGDFKNLPKLNTKKLNNGQYLISANRSYVFHAKMNNPNLVSSKNTLDYIVHVNDELITKNNKLINLKVKETFTPTEKAQQTFNQYAGNKKIYLKSSTLTAEMTNTSDLKIPKNILKIDSPISVKHNDPMIKLDSLVGWNYAEGQEERDLKEINSRYNLYNKYCRYKDNYGAPWGQVQIYNLAPKDPGV